MSVQQYSVSVFSKVCDSFHEQRLNAADIDKGYSTSVRIHHNVLGQLRKKQAELISKTGKTVTISDVGSYMLNGKDTK
ncbi:hypothetical protein BH18THE2_BH18THE2_25790 [soil metagenome]